MNKLLSWLFPVRLPTRIEIASRHSSWEERFDPHGTPVFDMGAKKIPHCLPVLLRVADLCNPGVDDGC
jgi:hypothetical protein